VGSEGLGRTSELEEYLAASGVLLESFLMFWANMLKVHVKIVQLENLVQLPGRCPMLELGP